nr:pre-mRNA-splicing factor CWC22 homolog isoform X2 [Ipomoea trifida]
MARKYKHSDSSASDEEGEIRGGHRSSDEEAEREKGRSGSEHRREGEDKKRSPSSDSGASPRPSDGRRKGQSDGREVSRKDEPEKEGGRSRIGREDAGRREKESSRRDKEENYRTRDRDEENYRTRDRDEENYRGRDRDYERRRRSGREGDNKHGNGHRRRQDDDHDDDDDVRDREHKSQRHDSEDESEMKVERQRHRDRVEDDGGKNDRRERKHGHRRETDRRGRHREDPYEDYRDSRREERRREKERDRRVNNSEDGEKDRRYKSGEGKYDKENYNNESKQDRADNAKLNEDSKVSKQEGNVITQTANLGRSGGVYIPPFKLARMMKEIQDKASVEYQRMTWDALRKSINGLVNKVNATNIKNIIPELFAENLIRGRGLFCRSCMKSQMASPGFTDVFAALVAVVNTRFPEVGDLLLRRIILQLQRAYKRNDKPQLLAAVKFIAHLVNQQIVHELIALELLAVLLENPSDDSVEVAVGFVTECGSMLQDLTPRGLHGIFERFRGILHEGEIDKRVQFLIEGLFALRKAKFQGYPAVRPELDLVEQEDQLTHEISFQDTIDPEIALDIFKPDPNFIENEKKYEELKTAILVNLRRTIYLTIMSSVDFEEAGHKLLKIKLEPGQEMELCIMLLECCSQERTYLRYYGLLGQRFCMINKVHQENFEKCFVQQYSMIHRLETNKLRNVAKFFAHLLGTDALPWHVLAYIRLTEEDTTSSSRIFIKILFQELSEHLGIRLLNDRLNDPTMQESYDSIFPKDNPKNTRFAINFFTSIGLGGITENLREYLKNMPRLIMQQQKPVSESEKYRNLTASLAVRNQRHPPRVGQLKRSLHLLGPSNPSTR